MSYENENSQLINDDSSELTKFKQTDPNYHIIYRMAPFERNGIVTYKNKRIGVYTSGDTGSKIRDAETGEYYNYTVGSKYEKMFFSVRLSTGECNGKYKLPTLFFLSPQHYESYLHNKVSEEVVYKWNLENFEIVNEMKQKKTSNNVLVR
jgi:hypothetical protein